MRNHRLRRLVGIVIGVLVTISVVASATFFARPPINPGFVDYPAIVAAHVILGGLYLLFAPLQFLQRFRTRARTYHRWAGRVLVSIGMVSGAGGLFMALVIPFAGWPERVILGFFGTLFLVSLVNGWRAIRARRTQLHREWMIRAFAVGLAIATTRLIEIPGVIVLTLVSGSEPAPQQLAPLVIVSFTVAFSLHAVVAELWIRRSRRQPPVEHGPGRHAMPTERGSATPI